MKKVILLLTAALFVFGASAQDYKFEDGDGNLEVLFAPLGGSPISIGGIKLRKFSESSAIRATVFLGYSNESEITQQEDSEADLEELRDRNSALEVGLQLGYESHFEGTDRISPYVGAVLDLGYRTNTMASETQAGEDVVTARTIDDEGFIRIGVNGVAGADYYFARKMYIGAEIGFGLGVQLNSSVKRKSDADGFEEPDPEKQGSSFNFGPNAVGQLRVGWLF